MMFERCFSANINIRKAFESHGKRVFSKLVLCRNVFLCGFHEQILKEREKRLAACCFVFGVTIRVQSVRFLIALRLFNTEQSQTGASRCDFDWNNNDVTCLNL